LPSLRNGTDIIAPSGMFCIAISSGIQCRATARIIFVERESGDCAPSWFPPSGYDLTGRCVEVIIVPDKQCSPRDRVISLRPFALQIMRTQECSCLDELYAHFKKRRVALVEYSKSKLLSSVYLSISILLILLHKFL
jgi:hypothetical protein